MSARTLSVYLRMFVNNGSSILRPQSVAEIKTIVGGGMIVAYNPDAATNTSAVSLQSLTGLGWYWETMSDGRRYIGHSGSLPGMMTLMLVNEQHSLGVIVLSNGDSIMATGAEPFATIKKIHLSLFECFENSSAFRARRTLIIFLPTIFFLTLNRLT